MKSYKQYCGVARALDLVGQRWALLLVRELLLGPRRFTDLRLPGLTPTMLSTRLKELSEAGVVEAVQLPPPAGAAWALTEEGRRLKPVVLALGAFGAGYLGAPRADDVMSPRWLMVSLQRRYQGDLDGRVVQLWIDATPYTLVFREGQLESGDGEAADADAVVRGSAGALMPLLAGRNADEEAVQVQGDRDLWRRVLDGLRITSG